MRSNQPDELDKLLDEALATYSSEEPRPGLEQRVLRHVRAAGPRRVSWWRWAIAIPVFAALMLLAVTHLVKSPAVAQRVKPQPAIAAQNLASTRQPARTVVASGKPQSVPTRRPHHIVASPVVARRELSKGGVFPLPVPLSAQERALLDLVTRFPDQAREVLIEANQRSSQPIEIPRIEIPPLPGGSERE
jgi:anti-sigma factor RsiW